MKTNPTGIEISHPMMIVPIVCQLTSPNPAVTIPRPSNAPIVEWVVETERPRYETNVNQIDAERRTTSA